MRATTVSLLVVLLLSTPSGAQEIVAQEQTDLGGCLDPSEPTLLAELVLSDPGNAGVDLHGGGSEQPFDYQPVGIDCGGVPADFDGSPTQACVDCPDPIEHEFFSALEVFNE